ncbi:MAG: transposase [Muribaculaceae bacterium]|nr:transposase [Muribaculaceae bacterium]
MKLTLQIKLLPSVEQAESLKKTISLFNEACNAISSIAWERRCFRQFNLHKEVYYAIKDTYGLSAQLVVRAISKVSDAYKLDKKKQRKFREFGAITYDSRVLRYTAKQEASLSVAGNRIKVPYKCHRPELMQYAKGEADLLFIKGKFFLYQTIDIPDEDIEDCAEFIGVDMGVTDIAITSEGKAYSSEAINRIREKYNKTRASVQAKGTRNAHKLLKRLRGRERRFATIVNHTISRQIVERAKCAGKGISVEDLTNIRKRANKEKRNKTFKRRANSWPFAQLRSFIEYKGKRAGVNVIAIPPAYTSQTCSKCLHIGTRNGKSFRCTHCGFVADADYNAACNIATWGYVSAHERWDILSCALHDDLSTSKADAI